jgi:ATP synthase protein I
MKEGQQLQKAIEKAVKRIEKAKDERTHILANTVYLSTLGLILVLPIVAGAYLGLWLDSLLPYYSVHWTIGFVLLGLAVGIGNVYFLIKK